MIKVEIRLADGAYHEFAGGEDLYERLLVLQNDGVRGKDLIDRLLPDNWTAAPTVVTLHGTDASGKVFKHVINYS